MVFLDADDVFDASMLESMYHVAEAESADVVVCGHSTISVVSSCMVSFGNLLFEYGMNQTPQINCFTGAGICKTLFQNVKGWPWDKLFRREFIIANNIKFQALRTSNDGLFVYKALISASRIAAVEDDFVMHRIDNMQSLENTRERSWNCAFEMLYAIEDQMIEMECYEIYKQSFLNHVVFFVLWNLDSLKEWEAYVTFFNKVKEEYVRRFNIDNYKSDYFYDQELYKKYCMLQTCSPQQYLMMQKNELRAKTLFYAEEIQRKQWRFPYGKIKRGSRLILYGAGSAGKDMYLQAVRDNYCTVVLWVDKNLQNREYYGKVICSVAAIRTSDYDNILIAISNINITQTVRIMLESQHISPDKIIDIL